MNKKTKYHHFGDSYNSPEVSFIEMEIEGAVMSSSNTGETFENLEDFDSDWA